MKLLTDFLHRIDLSAFLFVIICFLLVMVFAFMVVFYIAYKRNLGVQKAMKKMESQYHQNIASSNLKILEEERQRFAQDLHDEIGASLSAIRLYVSNIDRTAQEGELKEQLRDVKQTIDQSMASTRRIAYNLSPPSLDVMGLSQVILDLADSLKGTSLLMKVEVQEGLPRLGYQTELVLYRMIQELMGNTLKHAGATQVQIKLGYDELAYLIRYADNGVGFDLKQQQKGMGLINLQNRAAIVGGILNIRSAPQEGFEAVLSVPLS